MSFHEHNEARRTQELVARLQEGQNIAVITDAGLPGISDPGGRLIRACVAAQIPYTIIPGASAVPTALLGSGFSAEAFYYGGFLPDKSGGRERDVQAALDRSDTTVVFESPHRLTKTLEVFSRLDGTRLLCVARELTKQFEEYRRGTGGELLAHYTLHPPKGEITLVICGAEEAGRRAGGSEPPSCQR